MLLIPQLLLVAQHAVVCYNMAVGNFVVIYYPGEEIETESKEDAEMEMEKETESERAYKRKKFENIYMNIARI